MTKIMKASECKAKLLAVLDEVAATGEPVTVTKNGKPVAQIVSLVVRPAAITGALKGSFAIVGDIVSSSEPDWDEDREFRNITGQLHEAPARYARDHLADAGRAEAGPKGAGGMRKRVRRR
ncbi:MAG: type II toxin-antitoxin system Phd/YefM family antitoxin [Alphaproteobacteria bacterium]|nr:type II toxin-antitoxin system Phd/YefM family antitoxin [Alphaproteobacteria bacterium]MCW5742110.1 type II toxin-antitoxin system Phd/YefM family antitoxin [Alphaproteobacteria bacterium]